MARTSTPNPTGSTRQGRSRLALLLAVGVLATACSSTVGDTAEGGVPAIEAAPDAGSGQAARGSSTPSSPGAASDGTAAGPTSPGQTGPSGTGAGPGTGSTGPSGTATGSGGTSSGGTGSGGTGSGSTTSAGTYGPGITDEELVIGIAIADEASSDLNSSALGVEGVTQGNTEAYYDILGAAMNEAGGIAGRKIRFSKWRYSTAQGENLSQLEQEACTYWTQDDPAFAVPAIRASANFLGCAKDAGQFVRGLDPLSTADDQVYAQFPSYIQLSAMSLTRQGRILGDGLDAMDYFDDGASLGVVSFDAPTWRRAVEESLAPALARHGHEIDEVAYVKEVQSTSDIGDVTAQLQSTVLRFKTLGITHVVLLDEAAVMALLFMRSADNQAYYPRYGLTSQAGGTVLAGLVPEGQLNGAVSVGWIPTFDIPESEAPPNPAADACLQRFKEAGEEPADSNNRGIMLGVCESLDFVKGAIEGGLPDITADSAVRGAEKVGEFTSLNSFRNFVARGRHDAAATYRYMAYAADCNCFHYTSGDIADLP